MFVEFFLGAQVFAFLEQVFGLVALSPRVGERERAILARPVRVGTRAIVLAGHLLNSLVRNIEIRRGALGLAIPAKIPAKRTAAVGFA